MMSAHTGEAWARSMSRGSQHRPLCGTTINNTGVPQESELAVAGGEGALWFLGKKWRLGEVL